MSEKINITVNGKSCRALHWGDSPRERILNALYEIRRREREASKAQ